MNHKLFKMVKSKISLKIISKYKQFKPIINKGRLKMQDKMMITKYVHKTCYALSKFFKLNEID